MAAAELSTRQLKAIALLIYSDKNNKEVAKSVGVTEQTFYNWMLEPDFKIELMNEKIEYLSTVKANTIKPFTDLIIATYESMMQTMREGTIDERMRVFELIWNDVKNDSIASVMLAGVRGIEKVDSKRVDDRIAELERTFRDDAK